LIDCRRRTDEQALPYTESQWAPGFSLTRIYVHEILLFNKCGSVFCFVLLSALMETLDRAQAGPRVGNRLRTGTTTPSAAYSLAKYPCVRAIRSSAKIWALLEAPTTAGALRLWQEPIYYRAPSLLVDNEQSV
jgi:hypothetical protein